MTIDQSTVNEAHRRHRILSDTDVTGEEFHMCHCGKFFDSEEKATAHWWRALRAMQRAKEQQVTR